MNKDLRMNDLPDYNDDGTVFDDHGSIVPGTVVSLHNNLIKALRSEWPAFKDTWHITVDTRGGIVQVRNLLLSRDFGFAMHIMMIDPEMREVRRQAGELFERYGVLRARGLSIAQATKDVKRDPWGRIIHEN